jgi:hypothetical protein
VIGPDELPPPPDPLLEDAQDASRKAAAQAPMDLLIVGCLTLVLLKSGASRLAVLGFGCLAPRPSGSRGQFMRPT